MISVSPYRITIGILAFMMICMTLYSPSLFAQTAQKGQLITVADLDQIYREAIMEKAPWKPGQMEITEVKAYPPKVWVPEGQISFETGRVSSTRFLGRVALEIKIRVNDVPARNVRVCGKVEAYRNVVCAARDIRRGEIIGASALTVARMPISKLRNQSIFRPSEVVGMAAKRAVRAGQPITRRQVAPPVVVKRGARVIILAESPSLTIRVPGKAIEPGTAGDFIRVKNLQSKKEVLAKVRDSRTVTVMF